MLSKAQSRTAIRQLIGDEVAGLYSDSSMDVITQTVLDELWGDLLDTSVYLLRQIDTITAPVAPGYIDLRTQAAGGQLTQRFYRQQKVLRAGGGVMREYSPTQASEVVVAADVQIVAPIYTYYIFGNQLWAFPLDTSSQIELHYNYLPAAYTELADTDAVTWPEGYDAVFIHEAAARLMLRSGNVELLSFIKSFGDDQKRRLQYAIQRHRGPAVPHLADDPLEWSGI